LRSEFIALAATLLTGRAAGLSARAALLAAEVFAAAVLLDGRFRAVVLFAVVLRVVAAFALRVVFVFLRAEDLEVVAIKIVYRLQFTVTSNGNYYNASAGLPAAG
jgi:hypothetical protein